MKTPLYQFALHETGRCGTISCTRDERKLEIYWEMPGVSGMDLLLAPMDLARWESGEAVPEDERRVILDRLREWLDGKKIRTDIHRPTEEIDRAEKCARSGCGGSPLKGSAYCPAHYDDALLGQ